MDDLNLAPQLKNLSLSVPTLRIQPNGYIVINKIAYDGLDKPSRVELKFDPKKRILVLAKTDLETGYKVVSQTGAKRFTPGRISGARFCNANKIERGQKYEAKIVNGYLMVKLPKTAS